jgi:hypothetical protein
MGAAGRASVEQNFSTQRWACEFAALVNRYGRGDAAADTFHDHRVEQPA